MNSTRINGSPTAASSAREAGLRYVSDALPGIRRHRCGKGWCYYAADGQRVQDETTLQRIRKLALPPAWRDVWICPLAHGHLQASGRDARGRKQYRYHEQWKEVRDQSKYERMLQFGRALPALRSAVAADLARPGLPREKVLATVVDLLDKTRIRIGNREYVRDNKSYGLTTLRDRHIRIDGARIAFEFKGKSGVMQRIAIHDRRLARIVKKCQDLPGYELFQYIDDAGQRRSIESADVNQYLQDISGQAFTAKDFRTWHGTLIAAHALRQLPGFSSMTEARHNVVQAMDEVAAQLGNTRAICRKCYVHPQVIDAYLEGHLLQRLGVGENQDTLPAQPDEAALLQFLQALPRAGAAA